MFNIGALYKTPAAVRAIHNIEISTKKQVLKLDDIILKSTSELKVKKEYMQTDAFWRDEHNAKMVTLYEKMINFRDEITKNIEINNAKSNAEIQIQAVNGLARIKKYFDKNPERLNFWEEHSFHDKAHNEYRFIQMRIRNHARSFQKDLEQN